MDRWRKGKRFREGGGVVEKWENIEEMKQTGVGTGGQFKEARKSRERDERVKELVGS